ncbi:MAG: 2-hydroxyacyl-CoA dehydratase [Deltaproteobacteria bacterium]|nr:2-hydroxyacyl-CoA dehydratase [Deltaproteobacteria bacterium]
MIREYFADLASGLESKLRDGGTATARKLYALEVARLGMRLYGGGENVAWCGVLAPFDLLSSMGVTSCFVEFVGAMLASMNAVGPALSEAENLGYSTDMCSYHRAINGAAATGLMPEPGFLIATTCPCSGGLSTVESLAKKFKKDLFVIHVPNGNDGRSAEYLASQFRKMTAFVAAHTGRPLDPERLRHTVALTNRTRELLIEVYSLAAKVPTPARRGDLPNFGFIMALLMGSEAGVQLATAYRDEFAAKAAAGTAGVPGESVRLMWFQNRVQFKNPLEKMLEEEFRAAVVIDELNSITWDPIDPDGPFESFAARALSNPLGGPVDRRVANLLKLAREYRVDGVIHPCHWGCRQGTGARGLVQEALKKDGIPVLNLEVDCIDPRNFSEGQLRTRLQAFVETIAARKAKTA